MVLALLDSAAVFIPSMNRSLVQAQSYFPCNLQHDWRPNHQGSLRHGRRCQGLLTNAHSKVWKGNSKLLVKSPLAFLAELNERRGSPQVVGGRAAEVGARLAAGLLPGDLRQAALAGDGGCGVAHGGAGGALQLGPKHRPVGHHALVAVHLPAQAVQHLLHQRRNVRLACSRIERALSSSIQPLGGAVAL